MDWNSQEAKVLVGKYEFSWFYNLLDKYWQRMLLEAKTELCYIVPNANKIAVRISELPEQISQQSFVSYLHGLNLNDSSSDCYVSSSLLFFSSHPNYHSRFNRKYMRMIRNEFLYIIFKRPEWKDSDKLTYVYFNNQWCLGYICGVKDGASGIERLVCYEAKCGEKKRFFCVESMQSRIGINYSVSKLPKYWLKHIISDYDNHDLYLEVNGFDRILNLKLICDLEKSGRNCLTIG
jgi:hypothetical protein